MRVYARTSVRTRRLTVPGRAGQAEEEEKQLTVNRVVRLLCAFNILLWIGLSIIVLRRTAQNVGRVASRENIT